MGRQSFAWIGQVPSTNPHISGPSMVTQPSLFEETSPVRRVKRSGLWLKCSQVSGAISFMLDPTESCIAAIWDQPLLNAGGMRSLDDAPAPLLQTPTSPSQMAPS